MRYEEVCNKTGCAMKRCAIRLVINSTPLRNSVFQEMTVSYNGIPQVRGSAINWIPQIRVLCLSSSRKVGM
jgi:hypothetical protein